MIIKVEYQTLRLYQYLKRDLTVFFYISAKNGAGEKKNLPVGGSERNRKRSLSREGSDLFGDTAGEDL